MKRILILGLLLGGIGIAQTKVDQGKPGNQGAWPVTGPSTGIIVSGPDGGAVVVSGPYRHGACVNTTMNVGSTGTACPATASASRNSIYIELVQAGETLTITSDGVTAATATVGASITSGQAYTDNLGGTVAANCRCTTATCSVRIVECP